MEKKNKFEMKRPEPKKVEEKEEPTFYDGLVRINKFLANMGIASRREIDEMIEAKKIKVNGKLATSGQKVSDSDKIEINGKKISKVEQEKVYFLLNKPVKVLSAAKDDRGRRTVVDLIKCEERIFPVGRLDYDTMGAIILTNDGELFNKIIHPREEIFKEYLVEIMGEVSDDAIRKLESGVMIEVDEEKVKTLPAKIKIISRTKNQTILTIFIREGRNRQIRKMFQSVGHKVITLKREKIGDIGLGDLEVGKYRKLTKKEIEYLYSLGG